MIVEETISFTEDDSFTSIIMPMIKRIVPSTIASELVGVQPMIVEETIFSGSDWDFVKSSIIKELQDRGLK